MMNQEVNVITQSTLEKRAKMRGWIFDKTCGWWHPNDKDLEVYEEVTEIPDIYNK